MYWVMRTGKNRSTYVLDADGKPRSHFRAGALFNERAGVLAHAMKFGGRPMVVTSDGVTSIPVEFGEHSLNSIH